MVRGIVTRGAFYWLRAPRQEVDLRTDEWVLAIIRLVLSVCFLSAIIRPNGSQDPVIYEALSLAYVCYSLFIVTVLVGRNTLPRYSDIWIHCIDILWATQLISTVQWPLMSFALLFLVMISAAFRWGFWETHLTFATFCVLLVTTRYIHYGDVSFPLQTGRPMDLSAEILLYFVVVCVIGLLAETKASNSENNAIARVVAGIRLESGLENALRTINTQGLQLFGATQILLVISERSKSRARLFRAVSPQKVLPTYQMDASQMTPYSFPEPGTSLRMAISHSSGEKHLRCLTIQAGKMRKTNRDLPDAFLGAHPFRLMLASALSFGNEFTGRLYIVDPKSFFGGAAGLRFMDRCMRQISPVVEDLFMLGRLTTKARAVASGQVARDLHDGLLQSLSLINMQLEDLRQQIGFDISPNHDAIERIQQAVRKEITDLRDFTQQLRSLELDSRNLLKFLAGMAVKFQIEHGVATRFVSDVNEVQLSPRICVELARIAQEGLANVRKHSNAKEALVRLTGRNGNWVLSIMDNGSGFRFSGHRTHEELQASGEGPRILMERAETIGAKVSIESITNSGTCVEVSVPVEQD